MVLNLSVIKTTLNVAKNWTVQHSPEILLGTSIAAGVGATITGCVATKKMESINAKHREILDMLHEHEDAPDYKKEIKKEYGRYWFDIGKTWAPCVGLTLLSGTCAFGCFKIVNRRLLIAETAFAGLSQAFEQYRDNVIEDQGEEKDLYYANNGALNKKAKLIADGKYKEKTKSLPSSSEEPKLVKLDYIFNYPYNKDTVKWGYYSDFAGHNYRFMDSAITLLQRQLKDDGFLLLEDVYRKLGLDTAWIMKEKAEGRTYGWTLNGYAESGMPNDDRISFGIWEYNDTQHRLFRNGDTNDVTLHFNARLLTKETCELLARG